MLKESSYQEILLWLLRKRQRFRVTGKSMLPLLEPGTEILVDFQAYRHSSPQIDDIVVATHPHRPELKMVKRVVSVLEDGSCYLQGDNPLASNDSRSFGAVAREQILGRVTSLFF